MVSSALLSDSWARRSSEATRSESPVRAAWTPRRAAATPSATSPRAANKVAPPIASTTAPAMNTMAAATNALVRTTFSLRRNADTSSTSALTDATSVGNPKNPMAGNRRIAMLTHAAATAGRSQCSSRKKMRVTAIARAAPMIRVVAVTPANATGRAHATSKAASDARVPAAVTSAAKLALSTMSHTTSPVGSAGAIAPNTPAPMTSRPMHMRLSSRGRIPGPCE